MTWIVANGPWKYITAKPVTCPCINSVGVTTTRPDWVTIFLITDFPSCCWKTMPGKPFGQTRTASSSTCIYVATLKHSTSFLRISGGGSTVNAIELIDDGGVLLH